MRCCGGDDGDDDESSCATGARDGNEAGANTAATEISNRQRAP